MLQPLGSSRLNPLKTAVRGPAVQASGNVTEWKDQDL
jgi:hypothetical protein